MNVRHQLIVHVVWHSVEKITKAIWSWAFLYKQYRHNSIHDLVLIIVVYKALHLNIYICMSIVYLNLFT